MHRCNSCHRYTAGHPTFCPFCGRSYNVRICNRGHVNPRGVQFCSICGSAELSTPAAPESFLVHLSHLTLAYCLWLFLIVIGLALIMSAVSSLDWSPLISLAINLAVMLGLLYWVYEKLPGPMKKVIKMFGHVVFKKKMRNERNHH